MEITDFYLEPASYAVDFKDIRSVRNAVFVDEQQIPPEIEYDEFDLAAHHFLARNAERQPIGTGRLTPEGKLGRLAVLEGWRRQGVGKSLLLALIDKARALGLTEVTANAQIAAMGFYESFGFSQQGETFLEAGIPHRSLRLGLRAAIPSERSTAKPRPASVPYERLDTLAAALTATRELIIRSRRQFFIYSRDLEYGLYGQKDIVEALKQFAIHGRDAEVRVIIQEPDNLRGQTHPLLELAQRLTSSFSIRAPVEAEDIDYLPAFAVNDADGYVFRSVGNRVEGHWSPNLPAKNRPLREEFERVWQRSRPCAEFRALNL